MGFRVLGLVRVCRVLSRVLGSRVLGFSRGLGFRGFRVFKGSGLRVLGSFDVRLEVWDVGFFDFYSTEIVTKGKYTSGLSPKLT